MIHRYECRTGLSVHHPATGSDGYEAAQSARLIPKVLTIDPYDRHLCGFWLGAIGAVVRVP